MMNYPGAGFNTVAEGAPLLAAPLFVQSSSQPPIQHCDPCTWDSMNINVLENPESTPSQQLVEQSAEAIEVVYEFPFEISPTLENEIDATLPVKAKTVYQCGEPGCRLEFKSKSSLNRHWRTKHEHGGLAKFSCPECDGVSFNYHSDLLVHQRTAHEAAPPAKRSIPCYQCTAMFRNTADLDSHVARVHEKLKTHECPHCHDSFDREFTLQMHIKRRHSIRRDFQCPYCRKMFANLYDLVHFHAPVCSTPRDFQPYKCALCPQAYRHATSLSRHKRFAHGNATVADIRQSQLKLIVCDREHQEQSHSLQNHTMTKSVEDRTLGSIRGLFSQQPPQDAVGDLNLMEDMNLMFTQSVVDVDTPSTSSRVFPNAVWSSYESSDFSDSAISSMESFFSSG